MITIDVKLEKNNASDTISDKIINQLTIIYTDNGKGMTEQQRSRVFEPFYTTELGTGGSGFGMCVVYNLVTQTLNGSIHCDSSSGNGVCFQMKIPVNDFCG